jgi:hypothetical protein
MKAASKSPFCLLSVTQESVCNSVKLHFFCQAGSYESDSEVAAGHTCINAFAEICVTSETLSKAKTLGSTKF